MTDRTSIRKSRMMMVTAMAVFGTVALFVRNIPVSSSEIALYRAVMAAVLLVFSFFVLLLVYLRRGRDGRIW